jgi:hypothetical protein
LSRARGFFRRFDTPALTVERSIGRIWFSGIGMSSSPRRPQFSEQAYAERVRRLLQGLVSFYVVCAIVGKVAERLGMTRCGCAEACWCQRPVLSVFRWVFPFRHVPDDPPEDVAERWLSGIRA